MNYSLSKKKAKELVEAKLSHFMGVSPEEATDEQYYKAIALIVRDMMSQGRTEFSEKAVVILQSGLQFTHLPVLALGQCLFSTGKPFSTIIIFFFEPFFSISRAVKIPEGPAPMINTSVFKLLIPLHKKTVNTDLRFPAIYGNQLLLITYYISTTQP